MGKRTARKRVSPAEAGKYARAGRQFLDAAELAGEFEYWNAAGLLYVHGTIALADAVAVRLKGVKSSSDDHRDAAALFGEVVGDRAGKKEAQGRLERIIMEKSRASNEGDTLRREDVMKLKVHAERFRRFAEELL